MEEKEIYVVFASTASGMGKMIRLVTHYKYNHVTIALSKNLDILYSFARYNKDSPFVGGFVQESALRYFYKNGQTAGIRVYALPATEEQYALAEGIIENVKENSSKYIYNSLSAITAPLGIRIHLPRAYTCVEFVSTVLSRCSLIDGIKEGDFCTIEGMEKLLEGKLIYEGGMDEAAVTDGWGQDQYNKKNGILGALRGTLRHFGKLICRAAGHEKI